jgi:hypothetical protein
VILFSMLGWMSPATRPFHLALAGGIAASWFVVGPLIGDPGFCAITGAQHAVWRRLGRTETPNYMTYLVRRITGRQPDGARVARATKWTFYGTTALSLVLAVL